MYPLNVSLPAPQVGFAVANDAAEHQALTLAGYVPPFVGSAGEAVADVASGAPSQTGPAPIEAVRAKLDAAGIPYDKRWGIARLEALL